MKTTRKQIDKILTERYLWYNSLSYKLKNLVRNTALESLRREFDGSGQGISSSDISCRILAIYEEFTYHSKCTSIVTFCMEYLD